MKGWKTRNIDAPGVSLLNRRTNKQLSPSSQACNKHFCLWFVLVGHSWVGALVLSSLLFWLVSGVYCTVCLSFVRFAERNGRGGIITSTYLNPSLRSSSININPWPPGKYMYISYESLPIQAWYIELHLTTPLTIPFPTASCINGSDHNGIFFMQGLSKAI